MAVCLYSRGVNPHTLREPFCGVWMTSTYSRMEVVFHQKILGQLVRPIVRSFVHHMQV